MEMEMEMKKAKELSYVGFDRCVTHYAPKFAILVPENSFTIVSLVLLEMDRI
jgi:hypothetical protein